MSPVVLADFSGTDAIYVADTSKDGLPVVGHALLYVQDDDGNWYVTHYTGDKKDKSTATIECHPVDDDVINQLINGNSGNGVYYVYIEGDFSASYDAAMKHKGSNYGGYNFFFNNCLHYAKDMLLKGDFDSKNMLVAVLGSTSRIPMDLLGALKAASAIDVAKQKVVSFGQAAWSNVKKGWQWLISKV